MRFHCLFYLLHRSVFSIATNSGKTDSSSSLAPSLAHSQKTAGSKKEENKGKLHGNPEME